MSSRFPARFPARFLALVLILAATLIAAVALVPLTLPTAVPDDGGGFERRVRAYLLTRPEVIVEAMAALERRTAAVRARNNRAVIRANRAALHAGGPLPVAGNAKGDVTVVEFFDYRCPYCRRAHAQVRALLAADSGVRLVFKEFPVLGPDSVFAARAAIAAAKQGKYIAFQDALMTHRGPLDAVAVMAVAAAQGLDTARLKADMGGPGIGTVIDVNHALARKLGINGTPAFIIGDELMPGYIDLDGLKRLVARARAG